MRRMIPSLQALLCFESAAKHRSYTAAAQELSITQSAVSRQIQQLEDFLAVALFARARHGVELTQAGESYLKTIKSHLLGIEHATLDLMAHKGLSGTLKLGVVPTFATRWLLPRLHRFNRLYPEITIHLETSTKPFLFSEHIFDAAIYASTPAQIENWPDAKIQFLMEEALVPVCSKTLIEKYFPECVSGENESFDLTAEQISQLPLLQQTTRPYIWNEWFAQADYAYPYAMDGQRHELFSMLAVAAMHHLGVALIPPLLLEKELEQGDLIRVSRVELVGTRSYYFVSSEQHKNALIVKFTQWLEHEVREFESQFL
ncbi:LysR substrate-binding domain-containing protein [Acinetobacter soli]|uniref:LysR substrate-binding domain-containing protein n=1 Tax=Acinetobacter soli TaxID=487316 RepID=A0AB38YU17_9GAMM|nr:LysR substrate-binding domain-containing protein [Acinetobacter soli]KQD00402.1 LysR family transcriptional regulator [Acinetobacter soli]MDQ8941262.1 LysR substrate-binding domain-containing protein [Acinetobacter soli]WEH92889.1 LysR substrate-binding domain-containing protein [Acinetobacter soli]WEH97921.1 LysR substrate-binding domain-containing protein [Acinetobacter soli]WEI01506.1 LysR substrate-binding domain-containing protein [Acinetobacter soli]